MNDMEYKINLMKARMKRNMSMSPKIKAFTSVCVFFCFCYCFGSNDIRDIAPKVQDILDNIVWIIATLILIGGAFVELYHIKKSKEYEFEIYRLEVENLKNKKEIAKLRRQVLPDYIENQKIIEPKKELAVAFPVIFSSVLLVFIIIVRIMWMS